MNDDICAQCEKPRPRYWCWMGEPEDPSLPFHQPGSGPCPLGMPPRWKVERGSAVGEPIPDCPACGRPLDRIDHYGIEHLILDRDVYREVNVGDPDVRGRGPLASETDLRCGYCDAPLPRAVREFFYRRWYQLGMG